MAEQNDKSENKEAGAVDYDKSHADTAKAKAKAHDDDAERLAKESE